MTDDTRSTQKIGRDQMEALHNIMENGAELTLTVAPDVFARISNLLSVIEETEGLPTGSLTVDAGAARILLVGLDLLEG